MKKNKTKNKNKRQSKLLLRIKRLFINIKTTEWASIKTILKGTGGVILFTTFFVLLFALIDFLSILIGNLLG